MFSRIAFFTRLTTLSLLTAAVVACDAPEAAEDLEFRGASSGVDTINSSRFTELSLVSAPTPEGVVFEGIVSPTGRLHRLMVVGDEFVAYNPKGPVAAAGELVGWTIKISVDGAENRLEILGWAPGVVSKYALGSLDEQGDFTNLCPGASDLGSPASTLIGGARFDVPHLSFMPDQDQWVTLACQGDALFKIKELGHAPTETKPHKVQATLKMLAADYCGSGEVMTDEGAPVLLQSYDGKIDEYEGEGELEAAWDEHGAICLGTPRSADPAAIECDLQPCTPELLAKVPHVWTTWTP